MCCTKINNTTAVSLQGKKSSTISGYTFQPISILNRLRILPGYSTWILPTFDLMDDYDRNKGVKKKNQTKTRKQNTNEEDEDGRRRCRTPWES